MTVQTLVAPSVPTMERDATIVALEQQYRGLLGQLANMHRDELARIEKIQDALSAKYMRVYAPRAATGEYRHMMSISRFNVLPLIVSTLAQNLYADGYRPTLAAPPSDQPEAAGTFGQPDPNVQPDAVQPVDNDVWAQVWQPNRMDARQAAIYRPAISFGYSYVLALPGKPVPTLRPYSPKRITALYEDTANDEWPVAAVLWGSVPRVTPTGDEWVAEAHTAGTRATLYTDQYALTWRASSVDANAWELVKVESHGATVVPVVRYLDSQGESDDLPLGKIEPQLPVQSQLDQVTFNLLMAQQYAAFRQRWVTGMQIEEDESGRPKRPFNPAVDQVFQAESPDSKFGEFGQTDLSGYLETRDKTMMFVATTAQLPPHALVISSGMSNISAEALASLENSHRRDVAEHQASFGESHEQLMRLCSLYLGDRDGWQDFEAQTVWRDTTPRSMGEIADALGKLATMLGVPPRALWERIPGVTDAELRRWQELADSDKADKLINQLLAPPVPTAPAAAPGQPPVAEQAPQPAAPPVAPAA